MLANSFSKMSKIFSITISLPSSCRKGIWNRLEAILSKKLFPVDRLRGWGGASREVGIFFFFSYFQFFLN